jgi:hypothetical protein
MKSLITCTIHQIQVLGCFNVPVKRIRLAECCEIMQQIGIPEGKYNRTTATFNYVNDLMFNLSIYCNHF